MNPITNLAFYCCGVRMQDAASEHPVCADQYARLFMCAEGRRIYDFLKEEENTNASMLVRHRIIDDYLQSQLNLRPDSCIITIGAGFDSRPARLRGGHWFELDEPQVVAWKNECLPAAHCRNPLQRIAIDFSADSLEHKLAAIKPAGPVILVVEGVFVYLTEQEILQSIATFHHLFATHQLVCDLVSSEMIINHGQSLHAKIQALGTSFKLADHPETVFTLHGYGIREGISIVERAVDFGINKIPKLMLRYFFHGDIMGNAVYVFEPRDPYCDLVI